MKLFLSLQSFLVIAAIAVAATTLPDGSNDHLSKRASGTFHYRRGDTGKDDALTGPPDDTCIQIPGGMSKASNDCDAIANVYSDPNCSDLLAMINVGGSFDTTGPPPIYAYSVRFGTS
ncbi:hypothetical protein DFQ26_006093 [Actinomortierella ambigua]|nr:hypothetical protein DFQ26_006093 [Actinomortierella ambigua]